MTPEFRDSKYIEGKKTKSGIKSRKGSKGATEVRSLVILVMWESEYNDTSKAVKNTEKP